MKKMIKSASSGKIPVVTTTYYSLFRAIGFMRDGSNLYAVVSGTGDIIAYFDDSGDIFLIEGAALEDQGASFLEASKDLDTLSDFLDENKIKDRQIDLVEVFDLLEE